jgi:glycine/D-amino acid oxidase-like deaminating enzyme
MKKIGPLPLSLYESMATPLPLLPVLRESLRTRVAIIGGGYTGLASAVALSERGIDSVLLEAHQPGWGAAGRNGGQVNAGVKHEPSQVERDLGSVHGPRLIELSSRAPSMVFDLIEKHGVECEAERGGTLRAAHKTCDISSLVTSVEQWKTRGVQLELLNANDTRRMSGTDYYRAAILDARGGSLNPLSYARGLASIAAHLGSKLYGESRALQLKKTNKCWRVTTQSGTVDAESVIIATDGYSDALWPRLAQSIVPLYSSMAATEPLDDRLLASVMPTRAVLYEAGLVTYYLRRDAHNRLLVGGRGAQHSASTRNSYADLVRHAQRLWPELAATRFTHFWNGQFALTPDFYPRLHAPAPGIYSAIGYSGRGVALATAMGQELARAITGTPLTELALPVTPIQPIPFHRWWRVGVRTRLALATLQDALRS